MHSDDENIPVANGSTKQKSASEMYQKVSLPTRPFLMVALAIGARIEATGFLHWIS
jgi:hypothetical protein